MPVHPCLLFISVAIYECPPHPNVQSASKDMLAEVGAPLVLPPVLWVSWGWYTPHTLHFILLVLVGCCSWFTATLPLYRILFVTDQNHKPNSITTNMSHTPVKTTTPQTTSQLLFCRKQMTMLRNVYFVN